VLLVVARYESIQLAFGRAHHAHGGIAGFREGSRAGAKIERRVGAEQAQKNLFFDEERAIAILPDRGRERAFLGRGLHLGLLAHGGQRGVHRVHLARARGQRLVGLIDALLVGIVQCRRNRVVAHVGHPGHAHEVLEEIVA
jgi:hypothetical protein